MPEAGKQHGRRDLAGPDHHFHLGRGQRPSTVLKPTSPDTSENMEEDSDRIETGMFLGGSASQHNQARSSDIEHRIRQGLDAHFTRGCMACRRRAVPVLPPHIALNEHGRQATCFLDFSVLVRF